MKKNYFVIGLYIIGTLLVIWVVYILIQMFKKGKNAGKSVADAVTNQVEDKKLATVFQLPVSDISVARGMAHDLSIELETNNRDEHGWLWNANHISTSSVIVNILKPVTTSAQLKAVATIYKNEYTNGNSLYKDLTTGVKFYYGNWFPSDINKIKFLSEITNI